MRLAIVGLGKMGAPMARRLHAGGIEVVGYNRSQGIVEKLAGEGVIVPATSLAETVEQLSASRVVWLMVPSGAPTEQLLAECRALLSEGDIVVDGGNSNYHDSERRGALLAEHGIGFVDAGTSGGIWGLKNGYCLMVGGRPEHVRVIGPALSVLAPAPDRGWAHVGPIGAGHYTKMIHNGIEYGMMQAYAEGLALLRGKKEFKLDAAQITELWRHGSVVQSWLLDLTAKALIVDKTQSSKPVLTPDEVMNALSPFVEDSGEGRWTVIEAIEQGVAVPVISLALQMRFASRENSQYGYRLLSLMRNAFGGHAIPRVEKKP